MEAGPKPGAYSNEKAVESGVVPVGFTESAKRERATSVLATLGEKPYREDVENAVYRYLTQRVSHDELRTLEDSFIGIDGDSKFAQSLQGLKSGATTKEFKVSDKGAWFGIYEKNPNARKRLRFENGAKGVAVEVDFKEYFTVPVSSIDPEKALQAMEHFHGALLGIANDLEVLSTAEQDSIEIKTPGNLQYFIKHPDSLVIHFRNKELAQKIRDIVVTRLSATGLYPTRDGRSQSGFDFDSNKEEYKGSHSSLLSKLGADHLMKAVTKNPQLRTSTPDALSHFLTQKLAELSTLDPQEVVRRVGEIETDSTS